MKTGYLVKLKNTELYLTGYDDHMKSWSGHRESAKVFDYETAETIAFNENATVLSRHDAMGDV